MIFLISYFFQLLPLSWALYIGRCAGLLWYYLIPIRRRVAQDNLTRVFGDTLSKLEKKRIIRASCIHWCLYAIDGLRMPSLTSDKSANMVARKNWPCVDAILQQRKQGIVAVVAHLGSFDLFGTSQAIRGYPICVVVKDIAWRQARLFFEKIRKVTGVYLIAPRGSRDVIKQALQDNRIVCFFVDQHMNKHRAIVCSFFNQLAATTPAPVRFAMETGAAILPAVMIRQGYTGKHVIKVEPEFILEMPYTSQEENIQHNTQRLNHIVENWVKQWPEQWLWLHKRWKVHDAPEGWHIPEYLRHLIKTNNHG